MIRKTLLSISFLLLAGLFTAQAQKAETVKVEYCPGLVEEFEVKDDGKTRHGRYKLRWQNQIIYRGNYKNGAKDGVWVGAFANGNKAYEGSYTDGQKTGIWKHYEMANGRLLCDLNYENGQLHGKSTTYQVVDGSTLALHFYKNGKPDTIVKYDYATNVIAEIKYEPDGKKYTEKRYHRNGTVYRIMEFINGQPFNVIKHVDPEGEALDYGTLKDGSGTLKLYTMSNEGPLTLGTEINYQEGKRSGPATYYRGNKVIIKGMHSEGIKEGQWTFMNDKGETVQEVAFSKDKTQERLDAKYRKIIRSFEDAPINMAMEKPEYKPEFPGGADAYKAYLKAAPYAKELQKQGITDRVNVKFIIEVDGEVSNVTVAQGKVSKLKDGSKKHVEDMPVWLPGIHDGMPVRTKSSAPFKYKQPSPAKTNQD